MTRELEAMSASVAEVDSKSAERLNDLAASLETDETRLRWADVDMRQAFNTGQIAHAYAVKREGGYVPAIVDRVDRLRNMLILLPILLTWFALFEASRNYARFVEANPDQISKPFLLLWEQNFAGTAPFWSPSFSALALTDAAIIAFIIFLTFYSHGRREGREEAIDKSAMAFQTELDNVLAEATVALAPDRAGRPAMLARSVHRLADRFDNSSQELLTRLKAEHDRLASIANRREREIADFGVFASGMRAGAEETHRVLLEMKQLSTGLQDALEDLASEVSASGENQRSLQKSVASLERLTSSGMQSDAALTRKIAEAADALADAADRSLAGAETASQAGRLATDAVHGIVDLTASLSGGQARLEHALAEQTEANAKLADSLRSGMGGVSASSRSLGDISMALAQLREEFNRMSQLAEEQNMTLARLLSEQNTMASSLSEVARDLGAAGVSTSLRQREMNDELVSLVRRLDALAGTLSHIASGGDAAWLQGSGATYSDEEPAARPRKGSWPGGSR
ncbi:MAG TPA: hypothetical protein VFP05_19325 [Thermomicrobiales bacterium]|nr:hypothetical protein [Thermomicrobiales bacterium]